MAAPTGPDRPDTPWRDVWAIVYPDDPAAFRASFEHGALWGDHVFRAGLDAMTDDELRQLAAGLRGARTLGAREEHDAIFSQVWARGRQVLAHESDPGVN